MQTVGHHFKGSGPLTQAQRENMDRRNVCVGCHQEIPEGSLAVSALHHAAEMSGQLPSSNDEHRSLIHTIALTAAWTQVGGGLAGAGAAGAALGWVLWRRRRRPRPDASKDSGS